MARRGLVTGLGVLAMLAGSLGPREAAAFCRTTTCDPNLETCQRDDAGCVREGTPLTWTKLPVVYRFSAQGSPKLGDDDGARQAIRAAFQRWSEATCVRAGRTARTSLRFEEGPELASDKPSGPKARGSEPFGIYFRDQSWQHDDTNETIALTNVDFGAVYGDIQYVDMEINTHQYSFGLTDDDKTGVDLQAVIVHEVGHYIGLAHSNTGDSIMAPRYCQSADRCNGDKEAARELSDDDVDAVCALYPPSGIAGVDYAPPNGGGCAVGSSGSEPGGAAAALALTACAALAFARRRRTHML